MVPEHEMDAAAGILGLQAERVQTPQHGEDVTAAVDGVTGDYQVVAAVAPVTLGIGDGERLQGCVEKARISLDIAEDERIARRIEYGVRDDGLARHREDVALPCAIDRQLTARTRQLLDLVFAKPGSGPGAVRSPAD